jgi:hypothetical protein
MTDKLDVLLADGVLGRPVGWVLRRLFRVGRLAQSPHHRKRSRSSACGL